jgi:hypothetical protein
MLEHLAQGMMSLSLRMRLAGRHHVHDLLDCPGGVEPSGYARQCDRPQLGESTGPLTDDQVATLVEVARADRREDYDFLCSALGVTNGPELWDGVKRRARADVQRES